MIPFQNLGIGWVVPVIVLGAIGQIIGVIKK
jgi:branched-subunit amino acid permease